MRLPAKLTKLAVDFPSHVAEPDRTFYELALWYRSVDLHLTIMRLGAGTACRIAQAASAAVAARHLVEVLMKT